MRRIKAQNNKKNVQGAKLSRPMIIGVAAAALVLLVVIILILAESLGGGKITVSNDTGLNIEYVRVFFDDEEGGATPDIFNSGLKDGEKKRVKYGKAGVEEALYEMVFAVKFEGRDEILIYDGELRGVMNGNISISFYKEAGEYLAYAKAGMGLFNSTETTGIDTEFVLHLDEADWDYNY